MTDEIREKLHKKHIYTVYEVAKSGQEGIMAATGLSGENAEKLVNGAEEVLVLLRKRSECRKFVRKHLPPRRGRSHSAIVKKLHAGGIDDVEGLAAADRQLLRSVGMGEVEAENLQAEAKRITNERVLRDIGIPAVSLKKYHQAGIITPLDFISSSPCRNQRDDRDQSRNSLPPCGNGRKSTQQAGPGKDQQGPA